MSVISLTITRSDAETTLGIPKSITITSNIPTIIFYTLDGEDPETNSSVYTSPINLPSYLTSVTLKVTATNGLISSSIISQTFTANLSSIVNTTIGAKFPQATIANSGNPADGNNLFPFGTSDPSSHTIYTGIGNPDNTIFNEALPSIPNAFDGDGNPTSFTNEPLDVFGSPPDINNKNVKIIGKNSPTEYVQEFSSNNDKLFNPKALVIFHDVSNTDPLTPTIINRPQFSLENPELVKDGILLSTTGFDSPTITGSFIKSHYNPNTGKMRSYYRDSAVNRWIISEWDFTPTAPNLNSFSNLIFGRGDGSRYVYQWHLWARRTLG